MFRYLDPNSPAVGWAVRGIGDADADGTPDLAIGNFRFDCGFAGCSAGPSEVVLLSGATQSVIWSFSPSNFDGSGEALDSIGDFDGDGKADVLVGAPYSGGIFVKAGEARIHSGANGSVLQTFASPGPHTEFGLSVAGLGDVDGDGVSDVAITTRDTAYVCSGASGAQLFNIPPTLVFPLAVTVARYGDFDHDGHADLLVGEASSDPSVGGSVRIHSGASGALLRGYASIAARPSFGWSMCATSDFDGDGQPDIVVGSPEIDIGGPQAGVGFVELIGSINGSVLRNYSGSQTSEHLGMSVTAGRDFDGDGVADFAAASTCEPSSSGCTRYAKVWSGAVDLELMSVTSNSTGLEGVALDFIGDLTSDGRSEFAFGSACSLPFATCGEVRVYHDQNLGPIAYCTAGTTTNGCVPSIAASGTPSAGATSGFTLNVAQVEGQRASLFLYGINGRQAQPWGTGTSFLCVKTPLQRFGSQLSSGTFGQCNGTLAVDWLAYIAAHPGAQGAPFSSGDFVQAQAWFRDPPAPRGTNLTNAIEFVLLP